MQQSIKSILTALADQFDEWYRTGDESTETLKAANETWAFAAAELRGAAANITEDLYLTPISPRNISEGAINLYRDYLDIYLSELSGEDIERVEERAKAAAILDTMKGVEADVSVPEDVLPTGFLHAVGFEYNDGQCPHCGKCQDRCEDCYPTAASLAF